MVESSAYPIKCINVANAAGNVSPLTPAEYKTTVNEMKTNGGLAVEASVYYYDENLRNITQ